MKHRILVYLMAALLMPVVGNATLRKDVMLKDGWRFMRGDGPWQEVSIPHDWAIYGPFDMDNDLQVVAIAENGEVEKSSHTGRTGGLPYYGKGEYRTTFVADSLDQKSYTLLFDGAMEHARVKVNGKDVGLWENGYNAFHFNIDGAIKEGENTLQVNLEPKSQSSRWYPGAGLYRNVHLIVTGKVRVPVWGTYITTPHVEKDYATVNLKVQIEGAKTGDKIDVITEIIDPNGKMVSTKKTVHNVVEGVGETHNLLVEAPMLWSPETPHLYKAVTRLVQNDVELDCYVTRFGIRKIEYVAYKGFFLNDKYTKFRGVCNHHDLGPLGAAVNKAALKHQLDLLKDMGCNAIRTSHNMPAPELVELCDEMGFMLMVESFDEWGKAQKVENGYGNHFDEWAERDMVNMLHHFRNNPSVVMWSIGNEVPTQQQVDGAKVVKFLQDICHREDPTRPATSGMNHYGASITNGFASALDIPGYNYKVRNYQDAYNRLGQGLVLGGETASTVSSRGVYMFPVELRHHATYDNHHSSSYDTEYCWWSNHPDLDFAADDDFPWMIGQFVWTGFDYLGEPTPYDNNGWPNHSSMFGIIDLASIPKDRYYLYRSIWNKDDATLHILPHWNWKGREGEVTPVFVYTSYPKAELFVNGKSQGVKEKNNTNEMTRYRLMWNEVVYEPGEVKVVAYDANGNKAAEKVMVTTGKPHHLVATVNRATLNADGEDLAYVTVRVADKQGNLVPTDDRLVKFTVEGAGEFHATANGDPTCLMPFQNAEMKLFSGALTAIVKAGDEAGKITFTAKAKGVKPVTLTIDVK